MSHFTVLVVGENPETLLAPFDENIECEPEMEILDENQLRNFTEHYEDKEPLETTFAQLYEKYGDDWNSNEWKFENEQWVEYSTYNQESKWDWYQLGGRWTGYFKLKEDTTGELGEPGLMTSGAPDGYTDSCRVGDIDFEGMRNEAESGAIKVYDTAQDIIGDLKLEQSWECLLDKKRNEEITIEEAREIYNNQEIVKTFKEKSSSDTMRNIFGYMADVEDYLIPREEYLESARNGAIVPFAYLDDEGWVESGSMGWFGISTEVIAGGQWSKEINNKIDSLDPDTIVSIYDLHI